MRATWVDEFPGNFQWSNATLIVKGMAPYGVVGLAEIEAVCDRLRGREGEPQAWPEEWTAMGARLKKAAEEEDAAGHTRTAGDYFLRAGHYLYNAERFIAPGPAKRAADERAYAAFHAGLRLRHPAIEFVEVPCEGALLPGLFVPAAGREGPAPTVVILNGMDNAKEMSVIFAGLEFARRGMNALALDGPGQGEARRLRDIPSRHDYEVPGAAAYEFLCARTEVDPARVAIMGYSFGGYYAGRIAAREPRYAAGVAMTAPHWDLAGFQLAVRAKLAENPKAAAQSNFQFQWVVGAADSDEAIEIARRFSLADIASDIRRPFLVTHGADDRVIPVANAGRLFDAIGGDCKTLRIIASGEPGAQHAHVDDRPRGINIVADWLAAVLAPGG